MLALLACLPLAAFQGDAAPASCPFDRVVDLVLTADDPALIDGRGPTVVAEVEVQFSGELHIWTRSAQELFLRVEDAADRSRISEDDDSGGGTTPYVRLKVEPGVRLAVHVAGPQDGPGGTIQLQLRASPESEATREAAQAGRKGLRKIRRLRQQGALEEAHAALLASVAALEATPGGHHSEAVARRSLALASEAFELEDLDTARALQEAVLVWRERTRPAEHLDLLEARLDLAATLAELGELSLARSLEVSVLQVLERTLAEDDPDLLDARLNLAITLADTGDLAGARSLEESVLAARERTLSADHPALLDARLQLATTMAEMGDLSGARALGESVLAARERTLPEDHPDLLDARLNLAATMAEMGDLPGARALEESVLAARERTVPEDHPDVLFARLGLATTMAEMGDLSGARTLEESVVAVRERTLSEDHPDLLDARQNLATTMAEMGDLSGARVLEEAVLAARERTLPEDHPDLVGARVNLATTMRELGELTGARALEESVLAARERTLPQGHPDLLEARQNLVTTLTRMGALAGAAALLPDQLAGMRARVLASLALAPRQAREVVGAEALRLQQVLDSTRLEQTDLRAPVFELLETMRAVAGEAARALQHSGEPEIESISLAASAVRAQLNDLALSSTDEHAPSESVSVELVRLVQERDRLEREATRLLAARGIVMRAIEVGPLAQALRPEDAAVGFRRVTRWRDDEETPGETPTARDHLLAHVLQPDGSLVRIDLGPAAELEQLVDAWRAELGAPLQRGVASAGEDSEEQEQAAGRALRAQLFDPVLAVLGAGTRRLLVCADDLVFLVPLDALPLEESESRVGDRWSISNEASFARLLSSEGGGDAAPGMLAVGGVSYDAEGAAPVAVEAASGLRSPAPKRFTRLLQTRFEAETAAALFEDLHEVEPVVLTKSETTKAALFEHAPGKRYVHLATHGWFAPEILRSTLDADETTARGGWTRTGTAEHVRGMAPMLLCGLALAGANQGRDSLGRRNGLLTAEELCSLDLSACELAVLSACETNVGIRRAGQGIQSLQAALHAAGAQSSITSLWKVDDAATRRLMEVFYTELWEGELSKAEALWAAKSALREEGAPVRDWAGWVLTGDPG